jgi:hypothetical protein
VQIRLLKWPLDLAQERWARLGSGLRFMLLIKVEKMTRLMKILIRLMARKLKVDTRHSYHIYTVLLKWSLISFLCLLPHKVLH